MITKYKSFLSRQDLAANTVRSYVWTVTHFLEKYKEVTRENLLAYKGYLVENHKPQTVNLRLQAINKYLEFIKKEKLKMRFVKVKQKNFLASSHQQVSGVYQKRKTQNALCKGATEKFSRKRNQ